jgi:two-component system KDP operon response regulator KdpE
MSDARAHAPVVLIIEDEPQIRRFVRTVLEADHYNVVEAGTAERGLIEAGTRKPDLIILDLGLPDRDGADVARDVRSWSTVPILILSARSAEDNKVSVLDAGADDYLTKPFGVPELQARVRALLRRAARTADDEMPIVQFGNVTVDLAKRLVTRGVDVIHLTPIEYRLLSHLIANIGRVITHRQLLLEVWGPNSVEHTHYLRVYMTGLRRKLEPNPNIPQYILTEPGVGYRLSVPD